MYQFMTCRPAADDPAPSFCLQNDGLEFPKFLSTAHLRQQITPLCAICQTILSLFDRLRDAPQTESVSSFLPAADYLLL